MIDTFRPLSFCEDFWTTFGVCESRKSSFIGLLSNFFIIVNSLILFAFSLNLLIYEYEATPITGLSFALLQVISVFSCCGSYVSIVVNKKKTTAIVSKLQGTVQCRRNKYNQSLYRNAEDLSTFVAKWFPRLYIFLFVCCVTMLMFAFCIHDLIRGEIDVSRWYNLLSIR